MLLKFLLCIFWKFIVTILLLQIPVIGLWSQENLHGLVLGTLSLDVMHLLIVTPL